MSRLKWIYIDGVPYADVTPLCAVIEEQAHRFLPDGDALMNVRASPLDALFLDVAEKHGIDLMGDEGDEP